VLQQEVLGEGRHAVDLLLVVLLLPLPSSAAGPAHASVRALPPLEELLRRRAGSGRASTLRFCRRWENPGLDRPWGAPERGNARMGAIRIDPEILGDHLSRAFVRGGRRHGGDGHLPSSRPFILARALPSRHASCPGRARSPRSIGHDLDLKLHVRKNDFHKSHRSTLGLEVDI